ncbi:MAG: NAD-dependent epimerase/dehydratase family protein [Thermomonas sp.]|nr:NAD-dependent epimerase/dehydratase family protein [Thermomonas sp.]
MQALITGGAGFIGSNIAKALVGQGWGVRVLDDLSSGYRENLDGLAVDFRHGDVRDAEAVKEAVAGCGVVSISRQQWVTSVLSTTPSAIRRSTSSAPRRCSKRRARRGAQDRRVLFGRHLRRTAHDADPARAIPRSA